MIMTNCEIQDNIKELWCRIATLMRTIRELQEGAVEVVCSARVEDLEVSSILSSGSAIITWEVVNGVSSEYSIDNGPFVTATSPQSLVGLDGGSHTVRVRAQCSNSLSGNPVSQSFIIPNGPNVAFYGIKLDNSILSPSLIEAATPITFTSGQTIIADYRQNTSPRFLWMAEPLTEPIKNKWYASIDNNGNIGTSNDLFGVPVMSGGYRFYITNYPTANDQDTIQFKVVASDPGNGGGNTSNDNLVVPQGDTSYLIPAGTLIEYFWVIDDQPLTFAVNDEDTPWIEDVDIQAGGDVVSSMRAFLTERTINFSGVSPTTTIIIKTIKK